MDDSTDATTQARRTRALADGATAGDATAALADTTRRLPVLKTYKIYINGKFPRTESGHYYTARAPDGSALANMCLCSRKDFREAVVAARGAGEKWAGSTAFLRGQILYRIAEMMEGRRGQFVAELEAQGLAHAAAAAETDAAIDRFVYYAGWADKYQQIFSSVNPVSSSHFNFSVCEPTGVVAVVAPETDGLLGLVSNVAPAIAGGNTCVALASTSRPLCAVTLAEVLHASDLPGGVVNILTGRRDDLLSHMASHMDVNAVIYAGDTAAEIHALQTAAASNVKRVTVRRASSWSSPGSQNPYLILDTQEVKTTWHPIGS
ncbi:MAG: aldehyde dehydrogenase family protein [Lentisphaerae bacterium]|nr:aldehyde dehydrogenase family protein [Lentisphaerota bacterium]